MMVKGAAIITRSFVSCLWNFHEDRRSWLLCKKNSRDWLLLILEQVANVVYSWVTIIICLPPYMDLEITSPRLLVWESWQTKRNIMQFYDDFREEILAILKFKQKLC